MDVRKPCKTPTGRGRLYSSMFVATVAQSGTISHLPGIRPPMPALEDVRADGTELVPPTTPPVHALEK